MTAGPWPGCHGVRIAGPFELGRATGEPIADATVEIGGVSAPSGPPIWELRAEAKLDGEVVLVDRELYEADDGSVVLTGTRGPAVGVDAATRRISVDPGDDAIQLQLLATFAIPLLLHATNALVVHASACGRDGEAILISGPSGVGKSTALVAAIDAGWQPISEDLCAIDFRSGAPMVWPGPPWVRVFKGQRGPADADVRFHTPDKTAWDISARQPVGALPVRRVIVLEPPHVGEDVIREVLDRPAAIAALAGQTVWLGERAQHSTRAFGSVVELTGSLAAARVSFPRRDSWLSEVRAVLDRR